jgi:GT2 family glycosyltransferase
MVELEPGTYHSATVLNQGTEWAESELVAYVNSDAIMMDDLVLRRLADEILQSSTIAGAFARQIPRPDANRMTRLDYFTAFEHREELGIFHDHMSLVCSMVRKSVWKKLPFDPALTFAEDFVWSEGVHRLGYRTKYVPTAVVEHSHNYHASELYTRHFGDAAALSKMDLKPPVDSYLFGFFIPLLKRYIRDFMRLFRMGNTRYFLSVIPYRYQGVLGHWRGSLAGYQHFSSGNTGPQPKAPKQ